MKILENIDITKGIYTCSTMTNYALLDLNYKKSNYRHLFLKWNEQSQRVYFIWEFTKNVLGIPLPEFIKKLFLNYINDPFFEIDLARFISEN